MSGISSGLKKFGWIFIIAGFISGIYFSQYNYYPESILKSSFAKELLGDPAPITKIDFRILISYTFIGIFSGLLLIGLGEVINLQNKLLHSVSPSQKLNVNSQKNND